MSLLDRFNRPGPKRILALDGGGIRGAITLGYLEKIEKILQEQHNNPNLRLCDYFDLIGGTSTGAIIASALAIGKTASEIKELYLNLGGEIFEQRSGLLGCLSAKFKVGPLQDELRKMFGNITLGDERILTGLCLITKRADTGSTWPLFNHPNGKFFPDNKGILLADAIRASAAAPTYWIPQLLTVKKDEIGAFVDGGVSMANNPALQLFLVATLSGFKFEWEKGENDLFIVSIGTGHSKDKLKPEEVVDNRIWNWATEIPGMFMNDASLFNRLMLQYFSKSSTAEIIDMEIGDLDSDLISKEPLLSYLRYNVLMTEETLSDLGFSNADINDLCQMDHAQNRQILAEIGVAAAQKQVQKEHFKDTFNLNYSAIPVKRFKKDEVPSLDYKEATKKPIPVKVFQVDVPFEVETMEGIMKGKADDYLAVGVEGEMYPIDKTIFEKTYDLVHEE